MRHSSAHATNAMEAAIPVTHKERKQEWKRKMFFHFGIDLNTSLLEFHIWFRQKDGEMTNSGKALVWFFDELTNSK